MLLATVCSGSTPARAQPPSDATPAVRYERVLRGVVAIERAGQPVALGTVLEGDGRVLTALSGLGNTRDLEVRYWDGATAPAQVVRSDAALDLALLWTGRDDRGGGLRPSATDPTGARLAWATPSGRAPNPASVRAPLEARSDSGGIVALMDVDPRGAPLVGAPLLDPAGDVVAVLVRACRPDPASSAAATSSWFPPSAAATGCTPGIAGAPVTTVRAFLDAAAPVARLAEPATAPQAAPPVPVTPTAWLGLRGEPMTVGALHAVRVVETAPRGAARAAGLVPEADAIAAVDGQTVASPAALAQAIGKRGAGERVQLLVWRSGTFRDVTAVLQAAPQ